MACFIVHIQQGLNADEISEKVKGWMEERLVNTPTPGQIEGWLILAVVVSWIGLGWVGKGRVEVSPILWPTTPPLAAVVVLAGRTRWAKSLFAHSLSVSYHQPCHMTVTPSPPRPLCTLSPNKVVFGLSVNKCYGQQKTTFKYSIGIAN